jgi:hypothetical protein
MSDSFMMLIDEDVSLADAPAVSASVMTAFRERGLITGELTPECVLGGAGFRVGPAIAEIYSPYPNGVRFWELKTSGIQPSIGRSFNQWSLGPVCEYFACPDCNQKHDPFDSPIVEAIIDAVGQWYERSGDMLVLCPACRSSSQLTQWKSRPPLGFGNLSFRFWNWPSFDLTVWKLDIPAMVRAITGHSIVTSWGRV